MNEYSELTLAGYVAGKAEHDPDGDALPMADAGVRGHATRTYGQLWDKGRCLAAGLAKLGITRGDRIALMIADRVESADCHVACSLLGATFVAIDPRTRPDPLAHMLATAGCTGVIAADYCLTGIGDIRERLPALHWVLGVSTDEGRNTPAQLQARGVRPYAEVAATDATARRFEGSRPDDAMELVFETDPIGDPRLNVITHRHYCESALLAQEYRC